MRALVLLALGASALPLGSNYLEGLIKGTHCDGPRQVLSEGSAKVDIFRDLFPEHIGKPNLDKKIDRKHVLPQNLLVVFDNNSSGEFLFVLGSEVLAPCGVLIPPVGGGAIEGDGGVKPKRSCLGVASVPEGEISAAMIDPSFLVEGGFGHLNVADRQVRPDLDHTHLFRNICSFPARGSGMSAYANSAFCMNERVLSGLSGASGEDGGRNSGGHSHKAKGQTDHGKLGLAASKFRGLFSGGRSPALFNKIVSAQAMLLSGVIAGVCAALAFPPRKPVNYVWVAVASAGVISGAYFLAAILTGKMWVFGV